MPEPSYADRRKAAQLDPQFARARLVEALERGWEIGFRCQYCGAGATWRRQTMLGRAKRYLNCTMAEIQARLACPRCPGRMPILSLSGVIAPGQAEYRRQSTMALLRQAGLDPIDYGYGLASVVGRPS